jgi:hypothetical protein
MKEDPIKEEIKRKRLQEVQSEREKWVRVKRRDGKTDPK